MEKDTHDTNSELIEKGLPCEKCSSSDAVALYDDGHSFCYSCKSVGGELATSKKQTKSKKSTNLLSGDIQAIPSRGLTKETCKKWGVELVKCSGKWALSFPYFKDGLKTAQKLRYPDKDFSFLGETKKVQLYGQQLWAKGKMIVITEGEIDAMSVSQMQNHKWPCVSVPTGAPNAKKSISENIAWLEENFENIILMFDMDEPGQLAAKECAGLFSPGTVKIATLPLKDANEMLMEGRTAEVISAIWDAKPYRPDGVITVSDVLPRLDDKPTYGLPLPWSYASDFTYGIKDSQMWVWTSGSGMGKTEFFKAMVAHLIQESDTTCGVIFLEEQPQETVIDIAGKIVGKCFNSPDVEYDMEERNKAVQFLSESNKLHLYDHFGHDDYPAIKAAIRYMVVGLGCKVVFLDHITAFTDGAGSEANSLAERMMKELASMTRELNFNLQVISHVRKSDSSRKPAEEGGRVKIDDLKGSGAVKQWANIVIALERNQQAKCETEARTTTLRLLKCRGAGKNVGKTVLIEYIPETTELIQKDYGEEDLFPDGEPF